MRGSVGRGRNDRLVACGRHGLLNRTPEASLLLAVLLDLLVRAHILELAIGELGRSARLEGASEKQLRRQERSELHVKARARSGHISQARLVRILLVNTLGVDGRNVATARVPVSKA